MVHSGRRSKSRHRSVGPRRLQVLFVVAFIGFAIALSLRIASNPGAAKQPHYLADTVALAEPPSLTQPEFTAGTDKIHQLEPLRAAATANPSDLDASAQFAFAALKSGDLLEAADSFQRAKRIAAEPNADLLAGLGECQQRLGLCREALATYEQLVRQFPHDGRGYLGKSQALDFLSDRPGASAALEAGLRQMALEDVAGRVAIVKRFEEFGDLARALDVSADIRKATGDSTDALLLTTHLYIKAERPAEAMPLVNQVVAREPANGRARYELGVLLDNPLMPRRDPLMAEDALLTAIEVSPDETPAYRRLIQLYEDQGKWRQCAYVSLQLLRLTPNAAEPRLHLAHAYARLGDARGSAEQGRIATDLLAREHETARLNTVCHQRPGDARVRLALGRDSLARGRPLDALAAFQAACVLAPHDTDARQELGAACARVGLTPPAGISAR